MTKVTTKGQVTIPKPVRDHLQIQAGTDVEFAIEDDGRVVLVRADRRPAVSRFERFRGRAGPGPTTDELMALLRGE
jgi:AbrB family looped-hinge helix DNA binding protein